jgi:hypothetical protein
MIKELIKLTTKARSELERYCSTGAHNARLADRAEIPGQPHYKLNKIINKKPGS